MLEILVRQFLYYPTVLARDARLPSWAEGAEEVWITAGDSGRVHGLFWSPPAGRPTILFLHGNAQSVFEWSMVAGELAPMDCGLLLIDYPGYGKSSGKPSEGGCYAAGRGALQWLVGAAGIPEDEIILFGKSLGGGVATGIAVGRSFLGIVLESTFRSIPSVARRLMPLFPTDALLKSERYDTASRIGEIQVPILVIHGRRDELIPFEEGQALFDLANEPRELYVVERAGHNDVSTVAGQAYGDTLRAWLDGITDRGGNS